MPKMKITIFGDSITNGFGMDEGGSSNIIARLIEKNEPKLKWYFMELMEMILMVDFYV